MFRGNQSPKQLLIAYLVLDDKCIIVMIADFLKTIFCAPKISARKFCANKMVQKIQKKYKKDPEKVKFLKIVHFPFKNPNIAQSLKFFARTYGCTVLPFRNSGPTGWVKWQKGPKTVN